MHNPALPPSLNGYVVRRGPPGTPLVVHFEDAEPHLGLGSVLSSGKYSLVSFGDPEGQWYLKGIPGLAPTLDAAAPMLHALRDDLQATEIVCIGHGMGGYGAIAMAAHIGGRALAFSPDTVVGAPLTASDDVGRARRDVVGDLKPLLEGSGCSVELICGEFDAAAMFGAEHLLSTPGVSVHGLRGVDDGVQALIDRDLLKLVVQRFISGKPIDKNLATLEGELSESPAAIFWLYEALAAQAANDWAHCSECARMALRFSPGLALAHFYAGYGLMRRKEGDCGLSEFALAAVHAPRNRKAHLHVALAFRAARDRLACLDIIDNHLARWPDDGEAWAYVDEFETWPGKSPRSALVLRSVEAIRRKHGPVLSTEAAGAAEPNTGTQRASKPGRSGRSGGLIGKLMARVMERAG